MAAQQGRWRALEEGKGKQRPTLRPQRRMASSLHSFDVEGACPSTFPTCLFRTHPFK